MKDVMLLGVLVEAPRLVQTSEGPLCKFMIRSTRQYRDWGNDERIEVVSFHVTAKGEKAVEAKAQLVEGQGVLLTGRLQDREKPVQSGHYVTLERFHPMGRHDPNKRVRRKKEKV